MATTTGRRRQLGLGFRFFDFFLNFYFSVRLRRPHAQIMIFIDELLETGRSSARENPFDRTRKSSV
jgi:hypothetical protein